MLVDDIAVKCRNYNIELKEEKKPIFSLSTSYTYKTLPRSFLSLFLYLYILLYIFYNRLYYDDGLCVDYVTIANLDLTHYYSAEPGWRNPTIQKAGGCIPAWTNYMYTYYYCVLLVQIIIKNQIKCEFLCIIFWVWNFISRENTYAAFSLDAPCEFVTNSDVEFVGQRWRASVSLMMILNHVGRAGVHMRGDSGLSKCCNT